MNKFNDVISFNLKEWFDRIEYSKVNVLKISKANSLDHELKKAEIVTRCIHSGLSVLVEPMLLDKKIGRPDIVVLDTFPPIAYEIVCSESDASLERKEKDYPFKIKVVKL